MAAEDNLTVASDLKKIREVDFVQQFTHASLAKLIEVLGVTRKIPMMEGTTMYTYTMSGTLANGAVAEGEVIPLTEIEQTKTPVGEITLKKWRKGVSAEAIKKSGYQTAVVETDAKLLSLVQNGVRSDLFGFLNGTIAGATTGITGVGLQAALAAAWGQLQVLFEDDTAQAVYFVNPLDIAEYLGAASITVQTAFGMNYVEDFLGLGTVIMSSRITQGTFLATAKENIIMYYLTMNGDVAQAFNLTADQLGYIGINSGYQNNERAQIESLVMCGIQFLVEYAAGVVKGTIDDSFLKDLTVSAESGVVSVFDTPVSNLQTNVSFANGRATGTIKYYSTPGAIVDYWGAGNFLAFKISNIDSNTTSCKVGLEPSMGTGLVEIINDPDKNGIAKIADAKEQKFKVVQTDNAGHKNVQYYDLSGLTLETEA